MKVVDWDRYPVVTPVKVLQVSAREKARSPHDYNSEVGVINLVATKYLPSDVPLIARRP